MAMSAAPEAIRWAAPKTCGTHQISSSRAAMTVPIEPPAEIEQNSKTPSNAGLSSPTRTCIWCLELDDTSNRERTYIVSLDESSYPPSRV
jgi:hypothetical protein